jgi:hypothetical protein
VIRRTVVVNDRMQRGYRYALTEPPGRNFDPDFTPDLTPREMLRLGVFGGKYMTDAAGEFPESWFRGARLSPRRRDPSLNCFGVDASQPLSVWRAKGWIHPNDPRGWFQWYCRYYSGRRMPAEDRRQIGRWKPCAATSGNCAGIASLATGLAARAGARLSCTGPMKAGKSDCSASLPLDGGAASSGCAGATPPRPPGSTNGSERSRSSSPTASCRLRPRWRTNGAASTRRTRCP